MKQHNMALIDTWYPPTREHWELISYIWQFFPLVTVVQHLTDFYPQGKTSVDSRFNIPGKWAWTIMELPGSLTVMYCMFTIPQQEGLTSLPWANWVMAGMICIHYLYRAIIAPLWLNPSMSPIHPVVLLAAGVWQLMNGISVGGWLAGYGPTTALEWSGRPYQIAIGLVIWAGGLLANMFHDDELREIRRSAMRRQKDAAEKDGKPIQGVQKLYMLPENGLFRYVLYAHFFCEWIEWAGFWLVGGWDCTPARSFLVNEISTMAPRALQGKTWYIEKFGKDKVGDRKAVIPGIL